MPKVDTVFNKICLKKAYIYGKFYLGKHQMKHQTFHFVRQSSLWMRLTSLIFQSEVLSEPKKGRKGVQAKQTRQIGEKTP